MTKIINRKPYDARGRQAAAGLTRLSVLIAARDLFTTQGYAETSVADIARRAKVAVDTVYASIGRKPQLLLAVHDMELAEGPEPVDALERDYVQAVRQARTARRKIEMYADALGRLLPRTVPLLLALRSAGATDDDCREMFETVSRRRAANMLLLAADLRSTGDLRADLTDEWVAGLVWSMNGPDYFELLRTRGLTAQQYVALVTEVWTRTLLIEKH